MNRHSVLIAVLTFVLIILGALAANLHAVRSIQGRPLTFRRLVPEGRWSEGLAYARRIATAAVVFLLLFELISRVLTLFFRAGVRNGGQESERGLITSVIHTGFSAALLVAEVMFLIRLYRMVPIAERMS